MQQVHVYEHQCNHGQGTTRLRAIDASEHADRLQCRTADDEFFEAIWQVVNWTDVAERRTATRRLGA